MINEKGAKRMCCEDIRLIRGYERAVNDTTQMYDLHHLEGVFYSKDEMIRLGKYWKQPAMALIFLTRAEHLKIHYTFDNTRREKITSSNFGRVVSDGTRAKIRDALKGIPNLRNSKRVLQYTIDGDFICEYQSASEAARTLGFCKSGVIQCCNGVHKTSNGYVFRYA